MSRHNNKTIGMIFCAVLIAVLATLTASVLFERQQAIYHTREHLLCTRQILSTIERLGASAQDAKDSRIGYRLSGSPLLLKAFNKAIHNYHIELSQLNQFEHEFGTPPAEINRLNNQLSGLPTEMSYGIGLCQAKPQIFGVNPSEEQTHNNNIDQVQDLIASMRKSEQALAASQSLRVRNEILGQDLFIVTTATLYIMALLVSLLAIIFFFNQKMAAADRTRVQLAVTQAIVQSKNIEEAFRSVLEAIGEIYQFSYGAVWLVDEKADLIKPHTLWVANHQKYRDLCDKTLKAAYKKGTGVPGHVWESGNAQWITAVETGAESDTLYPRTGIAIKSGLHAAVGFPIVRDSKVVGVMEFFVSMMQVNQLDLMDLLSPFGHELGQLIERIEAREVMLEDTCMATFAAEISGALTNSDSLDAMAQSCANLAVNHLHSVFGGVWTRSEDGSCLLLRGRCGDESAFPDMTRIALDARTTTMLRRSMGKLTMLGHAMQKIAAEQSGISHETAPLLAHPLMNGQDLIGIVAHQPTRHYSDRALQSMATLANSVSVAVSRRQMEEKLALSNRLFTQITDNIEEMIWVTQPGGRAVKWVSPALAKMLGCTQDEILRQPMLAVEAIHKDDRAAALTFFKSTSSRPSSVEYRQRRADGKYRWIWSRLYPTVDGNGKIAEVYGIATDITDRKESARQVHEFYSMVSHELRTPLTSVHASLRIMEAGLAGPLTEKSQQLVSIARTESDRLIRLINDILDIRKLDAGMLSLRPQKVVVERLAELSFAAMKGMADDAGVHLASHIDWRGIVWVDQDRTIQMLENLLSNAIKFSPAGATVTLTIYRSAEFARFAVQDTGPGIPADQIGKLFGKFQQLDSSDSRPKGGTGLGLAITKAIAEQHGGKVGLNSKVGEGSTFWIELPLWPTDEQHGETGLAADEAQDCPGTVFQTV
jgi:PAS domain S-box-containing protein